MTNNVNRILVEKRQGFDVEAQNLLADFSTNLGIENLKNLRIIYRYDVEGVSKNNFEKAIVNVFSEPNQDIVYRQDEDYLQNCDVCFGVEYLKGQYDQRADYAGECVKILTGEKKPPLKCARLILLYGNLSDEDVDRIKKYYINPVDSMETSLEEYETLTDSFEEAKEVEIIADFIDFDDAKLERYRSDMGFAMSIEDAKMVREYFKTEEKRNPTITELKVIDTYWSDHCRHTTFSTVLEDVKFDQGNIAEEIEKTYNMYLSSRKFVYEDRDKDICLMDIATIAAKELKKSGKLDNLEETDEINACSIVVEAKVDGKKEEWLVMFKNETHNHPTEIEPFGGAATCLGGAIRDPLSGRSYVYQAMRVTGSGDPRVSIEKTLEGKLPQRKISKEAAHGYSSYGNQIGLATGYVKEIYDEGYQAKRMEVGAVIAATPRKNVLRSTSDAGDKIILLGGRTGRDGLGGATGSSKEHDENSILVCGSEVQKGNAPTERKIQRLFRNPEASTLIKVCNDFGAGGVSVAIGELADGLKIDLEKVTKKYAGLDATELAISESQERMAVVIDPMNVDKFISLANEENLEANVVAEVTELKRLVMDYKGQRVMDISRDFLNTNGYKQHVNIAVEDKDIKDYTLERVKNFKSINLKDAWLENLRDINVCSQKGMVEMFDSTIGAGSVLMPYGGNTQMSETVGMVAKLPVLEGQVDTSTIMTYGFDSRLAKYSPFHSAMYAVIDSVAKVVALGGDFRNVRLSLQEYFEKLHKDEKKWAKPFSALLGAYRVQHELEIAAIGGKDSMSGTFKDLNVPPTLISFAVCPEKTEHIVSNDFKEVGSKVVLIQLQKDENMMPNFDDLKRKYDRIHELMMMGKVKSASVVGYGGLAETISKMTFGNKIGFTTIGRTVFDSEFYFASNYGSLVLEVESLDRLNLPFLLIGETIERKKISLNASFNIRIDEMLRNWLSPMESVYPTKVDVEDVIEDYIYTKGIKKEKANIVLKNTKPKVFIPVFPGTNCEYDMKRAFEKAGAEAEIFVFNNLNPDNVEQSIKEMVGKINKSQMIAFAGGFSAGDEPNGSGKFIATTFRNEMLKESVNDLLNNRDGLMLGICNGFQALIKLGLLPYGEIRDIKEDDPTLTYNKIGRHISKIARLKAVSNLSPWLAEIDVSDVHNVPLSHGEGRFVANEAWMKKLKENGQIAFQYVDLDDNPSYDGRFNPNGSVEAVEGITSPDGRILGKMGHSERFSKDTYKNIYGDFDQKIFESGVKYFK